MANRLFERLFPKPKPELSYIRALTSGSLYRVSDLRANSSISDIHTQIDTMRALANDSQIATALSYYATDATVSNSDGDIIWATPIDEKSENVADIVNELFKRWRVNEYARDHILELATIGNLYIPTTDMYKEFGSDYQTQLSVVLDNNTIPDNYYEIVPSYKIPPENVVHLYKQGKPFGYIMNPDEKLHEYIIYPEESIIHFSLGGLLGDYTIEIYDGDGGINEYDIKFAQPLMEKAVQPTQTLSLLEDALLLSSLTRVVRFINVECGNLEEEEIRQTLQQMKDVIEQQFSLNTGSGDAQSFVNPQSPNNLIFLPRINGQDPISIVDLNMAEMNDAESALLNHYQDKKLSVLGVPKEAMNFSSNEGLGGAGSVLSQRSALYSNALQRLETSYISGWTDAIDKYFRARNMSGLCGKYRLRMQPIVTTLSQVIAEKRDSAVSQASQLVDLLKSLGVKDSESYKQALIESLNEEFPEISAELMGWDIQLDEGEEGGMGEF